MLIAPKNIFQVSEAFAESDGKDIYTGNNLDNDVNVKIEMNVEFDEDQAEDEEVEVVIATNISSYFLMRSISISHPSLTHSLRLPSGSHVKIQTLRICRSIVHRRTY